MATFRASLTESSPDSNLPIALQALWFAANNRWEDAHQLVQDFASGDEAWVHAYLHRAEGDLANARYWYGKAKQSIARGSLEEEWEQLVAALASRS